MDTIVIYHKNCADGLSAAWAAHLVLQDDAKYIPMLHHEQLPDVNGKRVYCLDISFPVEITRKMVDDAAEVILIDHHVTAAEVADMVSHAVLDTTFSSSAAVLTWQYFHPNKPLPRLLKYVEDQDLWRFQYPDTKPIMTYVDTQPFTLERWDTLVPEIEDSDTYATYLKHGQLILDYQQKLIQRAIGKSEVIEFAGHTVRAANLSNDDIKSEVAAALYQEHPPFSVVWNRNNGSIRVSLRSDGEQYDVSRIAKQYGGGGHKAAAGFVLPGTEPFPWKFMS